jgi:hypothetical protein
MIATLSLKAVYAQSPNACRGVLFLGVPLIVDELTARTLAQPSSKVKHLAAETVNRAARLRSNPVLWLCKGNALGSRGVH